MPTAKMSHKGFFASIMEAERLTGEGIHGLPPGRPLQAYFVDEFLNPPGSWIKGSGSFVVPVRPNKGLWFDWTANDQLNTAVLPTVKGCNPITGLPTSGFHLEAYATKCPKHGTDFIGERFCPECNYKWPDRNYQSMNPLWLDGFRGDDGVTRQFFFSEDELRDVATAMIGKENTVPAFGFAFYSPKVRREAPKQEIRYGTSYGGSLGLKGVQGYHGPKGISGIMGSAGLTADSFSMMTKDLSYTVSNNSSAEGFICAMPLSEAPSPQIYVNSVVVDSQKCTGIGVQSPSAALDLGGVPRELKASVKAYRSATTPIREVSIGAGAKIRQDLNVDANPLDSWKDAPDSVMTIYFVFQEKFEEIKAAGMRDLSGVSEGMLANIPVG